MRLLPAVLVGVLGFIVLYWVDFFDLRGKKTFKILIWFVGISLLLVSHIQVVVSSKVYIFHEFLKSVGVISSIIFFTLLLYSVFIEIPILRKRGFATNSDGLIDIGTYALSRHPGVLWYILMLISLFLSTGSKELIYSIPIWSLMNIIYAIVQDLYYFPRLFGNDYNVYKKSTPMIIPTFKSIRAFVFTYRRILHVRAKETA